MESVRIGGLYDGDTKHQAGSVWDKNKLAPTIDTMQGGVQRANDYRRSKGIRIYG